MDEERLIAEQIAYYRARASQYDDWWFRRGRYDRGEAHRRAWVAEIGELESALDEQCPLGTVLELACGTGIWTARLARLSDGITAVDASPEVLALNAARVGSDRVRYAREDLFKWQPNERFDFVFFGFWLSHVPPAKFEAFWSKVGAALKPDGRVFFVDSVRNQESTAADHILPAAGDPVAQRKLDDGREFQIFKIFYDPQELLRRVQDLGWSGYVRTTAEYFIYGRVQRNAAPPMSS